MNKKRSSLCIIHININKEDEDIAGQNDVVEPEKEGPVEKWYRIGNEIDYDKFYLGMKEYHYSMIPNLVGEKPIDY